MNLFKSIGKKLFDFSPTGRVYNTVKNEGVSDAIKKFTPAGIAFDAIKNDKGPLAKARKRLASPDSIGGAIRRGIPTILGKGPF